MVSSHRKTEGRLEDRIVARNIKLHQRDSRLLRNWFFENCLNFFEDFRFPYHTQMFVPKFHTRSGRDTQNFESQSWLLILLKVTLTEVLTGFQIRLVLSVGVIFHQKLRKRVTGKHLDTNLNFPNVRKRVF